MKKLKIVFSCITLIALIACGNNTVEKNSTKETTEIDKGGNIVGTWTPIALDFRLDSITEPTGKWVYNTKEMIDAVKEAGISVDAGNFTFKANGKGYFGAKEEADNQFTYKKLGNGKYEIKGMIDDEDPKNTTATNIEKFYLDANGQMIKHSSSLPLLLGKHVIQNSFELYKKK